MHQPFDVHLVERHEDAERRGRSDHAAVFLAQVLAHVAALEPGFHIAAGLVRAALVGAAMQTCGFPRFELAARRHRQRLDLRVLHATSQSLDQLVVGLALLRQRRQLVLGVAQNRLDHAVHEQVGIATDRAREVRVGLERQTEVTAVVGRVDRLLHRAQQHGVDLLRIRTVLGRRRNRLELARLGLVAHRHAHTQRLQIGTQNVDLLRRRAIVHAEQARMLGLPDEVRAADVGRQHRLFDQTVRLIAHARHDLFDAAVLVADDLRFGGLEIHRATLAARAQQRGVDAMQIQQILHAILALGGLGATRVRQNRRHFRIGEARMAEHHRRVELVGVNLAVRGDQHVADHAQTLHFRVQRTQTVGELLGQHGNHAAREIHAGGAVIRIHIDVVAGLHIVAHIGNRHQQTPALAAAHLRGLAIHGIVKVACVFAIDGDQRNVGQIDAAALVLRTHLFRQFLRQRQARRRELMRHTILAHRDLDFHAGIVHLAQHLGHATDWLTIESRRLGQFDHHHLPRLGRARGALGDQHILTITLVFRRHQPHTTLIEQSADDGIVRTLDDLDDAPLGTPALVVARNAHTHLVTVQNGAHFIGGDINVWLTIIANDKPMSITMTLHGSFNLFRLICRERLRVHFFDIQSKSFLRCPGGGIGRRTSFRY